MNEDSIKTESPLQRIWLTWFRGYRVKFTRRTPRNGLGGTVRYKTIWVLEKKNK